MLMNEYHFLLKINFYTDYDDDDLSDRQLLLQARKETPKGIKLPAGTEMVDAWLIYYWSTKAKKLSTAIQRVAKRCQALKDRTNLDWTVDQEVQLGKEYIYIGDEPDLVNHSC